MEKDRFKRKFFVEAVTAFDRVKNDVLLFSDFVIAVKSKFVEEETYLSSSRIHSLFLAEPYNISTLLKVLSNPGTEPQSN
jgi:hypothetical protein